MIKINLNENKLKEIGKIIEMNQSYLILKQLKMNL